MKPRRAGVVASVDPTPRQIQVYRYMFNYTLDNGYQPTLRDVARHFGFHGPSAVVTHLDELRRKGWVGGGKARTSPFRAVAFLRNPDGSPFCGLAIRPCED